jgi:hypothetical protein
MMWQKSREIQCCAKTRQHLPAKSPLIVQNYCITLGGHMQAGQVGTKLRTDLPPGRHRLARALVKLYKLAGARTLSDAVHLFSVHGYTVRASDISRYLNGDRVPNLRFAELLYELAASGHSLDALGLTRAQLVGIHSGAELTRCRNCTHVQRENRTLASANKQLKQKEAGLLAQLASARRRETPLPVPSQRGDRQRRKSDVAGARSMARQAASLEEGGRSEAALAVLLDTAGSLTPLESAASVSLLRGKKHDQLADTMLRVIGRERPNSDIIQVALQLHEQGMAGDAATVLRAAAGSDGL